MKKIAAIAAAVALTIAGAIAVAPAVSAGPKDDALFVKLVKKEAPELKAVSSRQLIKTAKQTCSFLRSGFTILEAVELAEEAGLSQNAGMSIVAGAIVFYCPEQENNF